MTPFMDTGRLTQAQRQKLNNCRQIVERAIEKVSCYNIERAFKLVTACCVLHNFRFYQMILCKIC